MGEKDPDAVTWASLAENAGIPVVGGNATDALFFTNPDFFPDAQTANDAYTGIMKKEVTGAPKLVHLSRQLERKHLYVSLVNQCIS